MKEPINQYMAEVYKINTTAVTSGARTTNPSGTPEFTPVVNGVRVL
jgi:hypothetical protein